MLFFKPYLAASSLAFYGLTATILEDLAGWEKVGMGGMFLAAVIVLWRRGEAQDSKLESMHQSQLASQKEMGEKMHSMVITQSQSATAQADAIIGMSESIDKLSTALKKRPCICEQDDDE